MCSIALVFYSQGFVRSHFNSATVCVEVSFFSRKALGAEGSRLQWDGGVRGGRHEVEVAACGDATWQI